MRLNSKFYFLIIFSLFFNFLNAKSYMLSTIPVPKAKVLKVEDKICDNECLNNLLLNGQVFSFLAYVDDTVMEMALREKKLMYFALFNINEDDTTFSVKIAILLPDKVIGRYATSTTNSIFSYLMAKNKTFELKTFNIGTESNETIIKGLRDIQQEDFFNVIAPMTPKGANIIADLSPSVNIFIPTVHSDDVPKRNENMFFGGINYNKQIEELLKIPTSKNMVLIYDDGAKGSELNQIVNNFLTDKYPEKRIVMEEAISRKKSQFDYLFKKNYRVKHASFFLNTPIVKTSLIMGSLTRNESEPREILSTQINYTSNIFSFTQSKDRENFYVANSISEDNQLITEANKLLNNDIKYEWINYSTTLGIDYFFHIITGAPKEYTQLMENNQIIYPVKIMRTTSSRFEEVEIQE